MNNVHRIADRAYLQKQEVTYDGAKYSPFTHAQVIELVDEYLDVNRLSIVKESYLHSSSGQRAIGRVALQTGNSNFTYELSWKNSLDGSMRFGLCSGIHTFICSNGSVYGDLNSFKMKHMGKSSMLIEDNLKMCIDEILPAIELHQTRTDRLREITVTKQTVAQLCGELYISDSIIKSTQLSILKKEIEHPSYNYDCEGTALEFYEHVTYAVKETDPLNWHKTHIQVSNFFNEKFKI